MITVFIKHQEWIDAPHAMLDGDFITRSEIVKVSDLLELNQMFKNIIEVKVLCPKCSGDCTAQA